MERKLWTELDSGAGILLSYPRPDTPPLERKLAAILSADFAGYSRLMHIDEERTVATLTGHRAILDEAITSWRGQIVSTAGDSVLAEFQSVVDAYRCALAIQQSLFRANEALPEDERLELRIGINVGDVMAAQGDIFGDDVNIAARIQALAEPGGICLARVARDQLRDSIDAEFEDLGEHRVKNIARPVRVFRAVFDPEAMPMLLAEPPAGIDDGAESSDEAVELAFWQSVEASANEAEYRLYLERYPEGVFADLARTRLAEGTIPPKNPAAADVEVAFWETVKDSGNPAMIRAYLEKYPAGEFRPLAEILLAGIAAPEPAGS
jgi:adenylate cyclase